MSLTSYRAAPPRDKYRTLKYRSLGTAKGPCVGLFQFIGGIRTLCRCEGFSCACGWKIWQRPTLPCLKTKYHWRWGFSRPSSEWDRVQPPRYGHQIVQPHASAFVLCEVSIFMAKDCVWGLPLRAGFIVAGRKYWQRSCDQADRAISTG